MSDNESKEQEDGNVVTINVKLATDRYDGEETAFKVSKTDHLSVVFNGESTPSLVLQRDGLEMRFADVLTMRKFCSFDKITRSKREST